MGKRSDFPRRRQDAYDTPESAVLPLLPHLPERFSFWEPCAGAGKLADALIKLASVEYFRVSDVEPRSPFVIRHDALNDAIVPEVFMRMDLIITNPPWTRQILHPMIDAFRTVKPTWLLFDADWAHTKQAAPFLPYCHKIVSVGRVSWMENGTSGKDNAAWYLFDREPAPCMFVGRAAG